MNDDNNDDNHKKNTTTSDEVVGEIKPQFMSVSVCQQRSVAVFQQPRKNLERTSNKSEVNEKLKCASTWINGYIPNSSIEFRRSRTSFEVSNINGTTIANRIFNSNKNRSIYAVYDGTIMRCKTPSHVIFTVRLVYLPQKSNKILIDVRRRRGCSMLFRDEYQALFHAAGQGEITPCKGPQSMTRLVDLDCRQIERIPVEESDIEFSLKAASVDIESKMHGACVVTLQDLSITTDPLSKETSQIACKLMLEKYRKIFDYIIDDITKQVVYSCADRHDYNPEEYLRSLTLNLLGNVLMVVPNHSTLMSSIQDEEQNISIIESLLWYVRMAKECPLNASLAAKCLRLFVQTDAIFMLDMDANVILENARRFGKLTYPNLEKEAQAALIATKV